MQEYDKSSKWLIEHPGDAILRLAGVRDIARWRALQAELVHPRRLPDGLLEVEPVDEPDFDLYLLEIATRLEPRLGDQLVDDVMLVWLERRQLPEVITLVLTPAGKKQTPTQRRLRSRRGMTRCTVGWHVVELWTVPAEDMLRTDDVGVIPWVPLAAFSGPPEPVFERCREVIDDQGSADERVNLLAVTQLLAGLRYNDPRLFEILGGEKIMIESPVLEQFVSKRVAEVVSKRVVEARRQHILAFLEARFGAVPEQLAAKLDRVTDENRLLELTRVAARCPDLDSFDAQIHP